MELRKQELSAEQQQPPPYGQPPYPGGAPGYAPPQQGYGADSQPPSSYAPTASQPYPGGAPLQYGYQPDYQPGYASDSQPPSSYAYPGEAINTGYQPDHQPDYQPGNQPVSSSTSNTQTTVVVMSQPGGYVAPAPMMMAPPNHMALSILTCFFCFWPVSIVAIIFSCEVDSAVNRGDMVAAKKASASAKILSLISFGIGISGNIVLFVLLFSSVIG